MNSSKMTEKNFQAFQIGTDSESVFFIGNLQAKGERKMETVMTRREWEKTYLKNYKRKLRKGIIKLAIATGIFYGAFAIIALIVDALCNISFLGWV